MNIRYRNRVSCKVALFTSDYRKILVVESLPGKYSLPGGHMEESETPDEAMRRELFEELGVRDVTMQRTDFWLHESGKLILGYMGVLPEDTPFALQEEEIYRVQWLPVEDVVDGTIDMRSYGIFVIAALKK